MKATKILFAAALAALLLPSCNKNGRDDVVTLQTPAMAKDAMTIEFADVHQELVIGGETVIPEKIVFTEEGDFLLAGKPLTKASEGRRFIQGLFNVKSGVYEMMDAAKKVIASLVVNGGSIEITPAGGVKVVLNGNVKKTSDNSDESGWLCRNWVPGEIIAVIPSKGIDRSFNPDFKEVADYLAEKGVKIEPSKYAGYKVTKVSFTINGDFIVYFSDQDPYMGQWSWKSAKDLTFKYEFETTVENEFLKGAADGTIKFKNNKCEVAMNATVNDIAGIITFGLSAK